MQLINGKETAAALKEDIARQAGLFLHQNNRKPHLAAILVGHNGASETYVAAKIKSCEQVGFNSTLITLPETVTQEQLIQQVEELNTNSGIDGILVQLPLPPHIHADAITDSIDYRKDVDGFHPVNLGRMMRGQKAFISATPYGILLLLKAYNIPTAGKHCVVVGRSNIVGTPMSILLSRNADPGNCTVTVVHSRSANVAEITRTADIIVAAVGIKHFVTADMVKPGCVVIDVGINRLPDAATKSGYRLYGDVDFENVAPNCSYITPVPNGVGPMTIVALLQNTLLAAQSHIYPRP